MASDLALSSMLNDVAELAVRAGNIIAGAIGEKKLETFKSAKDLVTDTDEKCEALILSELRDKYPSHQFIGEEETSKLGRLPDLTDAPTWFCDPLDGTTNFVHGFPFVCVSIGLAIEKRVVLGVVHAPVFQETYTAALGLGAWLNGKPLRTSGQTRLSHSLVCTELGPDRSTPTLDRWMGRFRSVAEGCRSMRCVGSCALGMASVASGRMDAFYEIGFGGPWDCAAAAVIVTEAGGVVFDPAGGPTDLMSRRIACTATAALRESLSAVLRPNS